MGGIPMGLFDSFKKAFHNPDNSAQLEQVGHVDESTLADDEQLSSMVNRLGTNSALWNHHNGERIHVSTGSTSWD